MRIKNTISTVGENTSTWTWSKVINMHCQMGAGDRSSSVYYGDYYQC